MEKDSGATSLNSLPNILAIVLRYWVISKQKRLGHELHKPYKRVVHVFFIALGMTLAATLVDTIWRLKL